MNESYAIKFVQLFYMDFIFDKRAIDAKLK